MKQERSKTVVMTEGSIWKNLLLFSLPLMASNLLQILFNMSDVAVVGTFAGAEALGSVGSTSMIVVLFTGLLLGMGIGVNSLTAQNLGAGNTERTRKVVHTAFVLCAVYGLIVMAVGEGLAVLILNVLNTKEELFDGALQYLRIYFMAMPAVALYNFGNGVYSASGNTKKPLAFLSIAGVINVILNLVFVIVFQMGVSGVALATLISQYISAFLIVSSLFKNTGVCGLKLSEIGCDRGFLTKLLGLGVPAGMQNAIFAVANLFIQAAVNSFDAVVVEGNSAAANADPIVYEIMAAFYVGSTSFVGQNYGAGNLKRVLKSYRVSFTYAFAASAVLGVLFIVFGREFLWLFAKDSAVIDAGMERMLVMGFSFCISAFMDNAIASSRGMGKTLVPTIMVILGSCLFRIAWIFTIFAHFHTLTSLYLLYVFSWVITGIAEVIYFRRCLRRHRDVSFV